MRLALFTDTYEPDVNGVARTLGRWTDYLRRQGIECLIVAPDTAASEHAAITTSEVNRIASLPLFIYPECRFALPNPSSVRQLLHQFQPTLIHVATPFNLGLCGIQYAKKYKIPLVASYHTHFDQYLPFYNLQWMVKLLWRYLEWFHQDCSKIYVPSKSTFEELKERGWAADRLAIWGRGIDTTAYHPHVNREQWLEQHGIEKDSFVVLYVGRLAPEKNVDVAIEAFAAFQKSICPEAVLVFAGEGPAVHSLKEQCRREGIPSRFVGFSMMPQLQQWYAASDVFLFPSATETFGNVVLEAMACGTAVIGADTGGVTNLIEHGVTGLQCRSGQADSFLAALKSLYSDASLRARMGAKGREHSLQKSWDAIFEELLASCEQQADPRRSLFRHNVQGRIKKHYQSFYRK